MVVHVELKQFINRSVTYTIGSSLNKSHTKDTDMDISYFDRVSMELNYGVTQPYN